MQVRTTDLARALECDPTLISRWARRGMPTDSVEAARAWQAENIRARVRIGGTSANRPTKPSSGAAKPASDASGAVGATPPEEGPGDYGAHRVRREAAEASLAELRLGETRGELIRLSAIKTALGVAFATSRDSLLALGSRLAPVLAGETDVAKIESLLHAEIHSALTALAGAGGGLGKPAIAPGETA